MWKAIAGLLIGILIGCLFSGPLYAGKKKGRIVDDSDGDGVVEFSIPLSRTHVYSHSCCTCRLTHTVFSQVVVGPVGLPWLYQRWEVDNKETHLNRLKKFGPAYWRPRDDFIVDPWDMREEDFGRLYPQSH